MKRKILFGAMTMLPLLLAGNTRDRARAPGSRCAAGDDVDPLDQALRHDVEVVGPGETVSVEQGEGADRSEAAHVGGGYAAVCIARRRRRRRRGAELGGVVQDLCDARPVAECEFGLADHGRRRRRVEARTLDARTGNDDFAVRSGSFGGGIGRLRIGRADAGQHRERGTGVPAGLNELHGYPLCQNGRRDLLAAR